MRILKLNRSGDTIVEVLVAISVIGLILVGGYTTANVSYAAERQAQERSIALGLLESQLEQLRTLGSTMFPAQDFCTVKQGNGTISTSLTTDNGGIACNFNSSGSPNNTAEPVFHISISGPTNNVFTASAWWYKAGGSTKENMTMYYKLP